ncbi:hypothetical protein QFZ63_000378 [Streptomyces sp. B3I7]|uniref:hypothetical protein n=1 Tax=Streptomyces sp. B3I7 TaxID=3042269 RepID=UPI002785DA57|nr:hypothetical protein [Streptomyces sp. B3I7]MDQ0808664.1 hypothetical protein [Streptomyces sp. B3I7]
MWSNGVLITSSPAEIDGVAACRPLRLRNDDGQELNETAAAFAAGRGHVFGVTEGLGCRTALAFHPTTPRKASAR